LRPWHAVGVDAAIIVCTFNLYRYDPSFALEVYAKYPERFRVVKPIDPSPRRHRFGADTEWSGGI
jgi:hypothetical protein